MYLTKEILNRIEFREGISIKVGEGDSNLIEGLKKNLQEAFGSMKNLNIEVSPHVKLGGCLIETDWNQIDATVEAQLLNLEQTLKAQGTGGSS